MLKHLQILTLATLAFGFATEASQAKEPLLDGVRSFICDEQPFILIENDQGWTLAEAPELRVQETRNGGWQLGDQGMGFIAYLREKERGKWIIENLAEDGYEKLECINVTESLSGVVTIIKPRLNESIEETQQQLATSIEQLSSLQKQSNEAQIRIDSLEADYNEALAKIAADYRRRTTLEQQANALSAENEGLIADLRSAQASLEELQKSLSEMKVRYSRLLNGESADVIALELDALVEMSPSDRNQRISEMSLGTKGLDRQDFVTVCIRALRDKAVLGGACREKLIEFILMEGLYLTQ